jgi:hypothetical protein
MVQPSHIPAALDVTLAERWGYKSRDIVMLTDDTRDSRRLPTRKNMIEAMRWLVQGARSQDALFFHCKFTRLTYVCTDIQIRYNVQQILDMVAKPETWTEMK